MIDKEIDSLKKLCIGTYLNILCQAKSSVLQKDFISTLLYFSDKIYKEYTEDPTQQGHLKDGHDNISFDYAKIVRDSDPESIFQHFSHNIVPKLNIHKHKQIILAFRAIIKEDVDIADDCPIGPIEGYTKSNILNKNTFSLPGLLTNIFIYCTTQVQNKPYKSNIKEIKNGFVDSFDNQIQSINICETLQTIETPLEATAKLKNFNNVFTEVNHPQTLTLANPSMVKMYHLNLADYKFTHKEIADFIKDNLGRYVFSRAKRNEYLINDNLENIVHDAATLLRKKDNFQPESQFREIMLYSFLESILNAPKLMSKVELQNLGGQYKSKSAGVHLLSIVGNPTPIHQLVFGCADTVSNLNEAIDSAFQQIQSIKENSTEEHTLIESNILNTSFSQEEVAFLKSTICPQKNKPQKPNTAFGVFLAYNVCVPNADKIPSEEYLPILTKKLVDDITASVPYIQRKIEEQNLMRHSFYVYVLPLDDIGTDCKKIMDEALGI